VYPSSQNRPCSLTHLLLTGYRSENDTSHKSSVSFTNQILDFISGMYFTLLLKELIRMLR
jgi:hypothetical protein